MKRTLQLHRWIVCLTRRHWWKDDIDGLTARRLLEGIPPTPQNVEQWLFDLRCMVRLAWETSPDGRYLASLSEQAAALNLQRLLQRIDAQGFISRMNKERSA